MNEIRLMIIEDNKLLREGIRAMLKPETDIKVVAAIGDSKKVHDKISGLKPQVLLVDLGLVNLNSLKLVKSLKKKFPKLEIIAMCLLPVQSEIKQFIEAGITGFILKDAATPDFMNTIKSAARGEKVFPPQAEGSLFCEIVDSAINELLDSKLIESLRMTGDEKKIVKLISAGYTERKISVKMGLPVSIVKGHKDNILEKMSLSTRVQIGVYRDSSVRNSDPKRDGNNKLKKTSKPKKTIKF